MDIPHNPGRGLSSGMIRLAIAVGILAAAYFLVVKPALKSVDDTTHRFGHAFERSFESAGVDLGKTFDDVSRQVQRDVERSFHTARQAGSPKRLVRCVKHADGNEHKIQRCALKF